MKKILLAEDEDILRMLIMDTLEEKDYIVHEATDGQEALDFMEENEYDLLILDYMMPRFTGLELINHIRNTLNDQDAKILMLSAKSQQYEQDRVLKAGANFFISKPFSPMELLEKIEVILDGNESLF